LSYIVINAVVEARRWLTCFLSVEMATRIICSFEHVFCEVVSEVLCDVIPCRKSTSSSDSSSLALFEPENQDNGTFETSVTVYQATKHNIPEELNHLQCRPETHKSIKFFFSHLIILLNCP
jgi:hypothetical protein